MTGLHAALAALLDAPFDTLEVETVSDSSGEYVIEQADVIRVDELRRLLAEHPADLPVATDSTTADDSEGRLARAAREYDRVRTDPTVSEAWKRRSEDALIAVIMDDGTTAALIERSSFGTPEAVALRASVSDEVAARVVARAKELEADAPAPAPNPEPSDRAGLSETERGEAYYREHGWSGCDGSSWERLPTATRDGWEHAARLADRLAVAEQERAQAMTVSAVRTEQRDRLRDELLPAERARAEAAEQERNEARERYADAVQHGVVVGEAWERALERAEATEQEAAALRAQVTAVEARIRWLRERARCVRDGEPS